MLSSGFFFLKISRNLLYTESRILYIFNINPGNEHTLCCIVQPPGKQQEEVKQLIQENYGINQMIADSPRAIATQVDILLLYVWLNLPEWLRDYQAYSQQMSYSNIKRHVYILQQMTRICMSMQQESVVSKTLYEGYGNCNICFRKCCIHTRCKQEMCKYGMLGRVVIYKNLNHQYINLEIIHLVLRNKVLLETYLELKGQLYIQGYSTNWK